MYDLHVQRPVPAVRIDVQRILTAQFSAHIAVAYELLCLCFSNSCPNFYFSISRSVSDSSALSHTPSSPPRHFAFSSHILVLFRPLYAPTDPHLCLPACRGLLTCSLLVSHVSASPGAPAAQSASSLFFSLTRLFLCAAGAYTRLSF